MQYVLKKNTLQPGATIPITAEEFESIRQARELMSDALALEDKWGLLLFNYHELENSVLLCSTEAMLYNHMSYEELYDLTAPLSPRVANLLSSARLYVDQTPHHLGGSTDARYTSVAAERSRHYDDCFEYRFMEALRNYVQHRGNPVHNTQHGGKWIEGRSKLEFGTILQVKKSRLAEDKSFKSAVLSEMPEAVDLMHCARHYVERLSHIHGFIRKTIGKEVEGARANIESMHDRYPWGALEPRVSLHAMHFENHVLKESLPLLLEWDDIRRKLEKRNSVLVNLSKRFVTSSPTI